LTDLLAPLVVALTHTGFHGTFPVDRRRWAGLLESPTGSAEELEQRILASPDPEVRRSLEALDVVRLELARLAGEGVWTVTWFDSGYPARGRERLGAKGPPVLFGIGEVALLGRPYAAILGSRNASPHAIHFAESCAIAASGKGWGVVSGGARGVDVAGAVASCRSKGFSLAVCADALSQTYRKLLRAGCEPERLGAITVNHPDSGFSVGQAMGRNKLVYASAEVAIVAACEHGSGGTWAGAIEALRAGAPPVAVWTGAGSPDGNAKLAEAGAVAVQFPPEALEMRSPQAQAGLFGPER
jgi:predicted Rossmann fold nucleotide-binding protein DprA/Smf involved in DNA uptake